MSLFTCLRQAKKKQYFSACGTHKLLVSSKKGTHKTIFLRQGMNNDVFACGACEKAF
jgi:hypothetical protein